MKRHGYLYEKIFTLENVEAAWHAYNKHRPLSLRVEYDPVRAAQILERMKTDFRECIGKPRIKYIFEAGKRRRLQIPSFASSVAQLALWNVCGEFVERRIHAHSYSSRKGMGGHLAARKISRFVHTHADGAARYALTFDIRKYYQHINPVIMMDRLRTVFKDARVLELFKVVLDSADEGLPIGYPFSHALANLCLVPLYMLIMSVKGVSRGDVYMDNHVFFSAHKKPLHRAREYAQGWLRGIGCELKNDWQIAPVLSRGVKICGFVIGVHGVRLYRRLWRRTLRNFDRLTETWDYHEYLSLMSRKGWLMAANKHHSNKFKIEGGYLWR